MKYFKIPIEVWESKGSIIDKIIYLEILFRKGKRKMNQGYFVAEFGCSQEEEDNSITRLILLNHILVKNNKKGNRHLSPNLPKTEKTPEQLEHAKNMRELIIWASQKGFPRQGSITTNARYASLLLKKNGLIKIKDWVEACLSWHGTYNDFLPKVYDFTGMYYKQAKIEDAISRNNYLSGQHENIAKID
jgi:hypothetical protein